MSGKRLWRAEDVAERFSNCGCRVIVAHPVRNIAPNQDIIFNAFIERLVQMVNRNWVHGLESGYRMYDKAQQAMAEKMVQQIQQKTKKEFIGERSNPDFHYCRRPREQDMKLGERFLDTSGKPYWSLMTPDRDSFFVDGAFLTRGRIEQAKSAFESGNWEESLAQLNSALTIHPYAEQITELKRQTYRRLYESWSEG
jgi:hypothetical protein